MIYSQFGCKVEPTHYLGKHKPKWAPFPLMLIRAKRSDMDRPDRPADVKHYYTTVLRADDGINEIERAVDGLPELKLDGKELKAAMRDAD